MGFLLLQADLDRHPGKSICLHNDQVYFTFKKSSAFIRGGVLVWIMHVANRCYASFPKQSCQCIAILSYDIHCNCCSLGPFLGHRSICWFSQNGDDIFVMHTKTWRSTYYFSFSDQQNLGTISKLRGLSVVEERNGKVLCHHMIVILILLSKRISWFIPTMCSVWAVSCSFLLFLLLKDKRQVVSTYHFKNHHRFLMKRLLWPTNVWNGYIFS